MRPAIRSAPLFTAPLFTILAAALFAAFLCLVPRPGATAGLALELQKTEDSPKGCLATMSIGNGLGQTLDRFRLDLVLFDGKGAVFDRLLIDLAPLPASRTLVANIPLHGGDCARISRIQLHAIPACRAQDGGDYDCRSGLAVSTRTAIDFSQ